MHQLLEGRSSGWVWGFECFVMGLAELGKGSLDTARTYMEEACDTFHRVRHTENLGWAMAGLSYVDLQQGQLVQARQHVCAALVAVDQTKTFFPFIYALPAAVHLLNAAGQTALAEGANDLAWRYGFIANSRWFAQVLPLPPRPEPVETRAPAPEVAHALIPEILSALRLSSA